MSYIRVIREIKLENNSSVIWTLRNYSQFLNGEVEVMESGIEEKEADGWK